MLKNFIKIFALICTILLSNSCATTRTVPTLYKPEQPVCSASVDKFIQGIHNPVPKLTKPTVDEVLDMLECIELLRSGYKINL